MIAAVLAMALRLGGLEAFPEVERFGPLPRDVRVLIDRRAACNHWYGEEPYDRARARDIARAIRDLRCAGVEREARRLERRYARSPAILRALAETRDWQ